MAALNFSAGTPGVEKRRGWNPPHPRGSGDNCNVESAYAHKHDSVEPASTPVAAFPACSLEDPCTPRSHRRPHGWDRPSDGSLFEAALCRLIRHVDTRAGDIEFPPVINAAQPTHFVTTKKQRGASMRTVPRQEPHFSIRVAESDQVLREDAEPHRCAVRLWQLARERDGNQKRRKSSPIGVPGAVRQSISFSSLDNMESPFRALSGLLK